MKITTEERFKILVNYYDTKIEELEKELPLPTIKNITN
jgi:hypothetical protein